MKKFRKIDGRLFICYLFIKNFNETVSLTTQKFKPFTPPHLKMELSPSDKNVTLTLTKKKM